jgi:hypothetical protein
MIQLVGHEKVRERLLFNEDLPRVSLFLGPHSVGRRRYANEIARHGTNAPQDILRIHRLTAGLAREASRFLRISPRGTGLRFAIIDVDDPSPGALTTLLKALEEMPDTSRAILIASSTPPDTIMGRATVFEFTLLSEQEVREVLLMRGFGAGEAETRAKMSGGQVKPAIERSEHVKLKTLVLLLTKYIREHDFASIEKLGSRWTDEHTELLVRLCYEATTKRWRLFDEGEIGNVPPKVWIGLLRALKHDVRARLVVHAQILGVVRSLA